MVAHGVSSACAIAWLMRARPIAQRGVPDGVPFPARAGRPPGPAKDDHVRNEGPRWGTGDADTARSSSAFGSEAALTSAGTRPRARLAMFLPDLSGGGAERVMARLAGGFVDHGVAVDLLVARRSGPWVSEVNASVRVLELGGRGVVSAFLPLTRYLVREKPAALLSTLHHANVVACAAHSFSRAETRLVLREASDPTHVGPQTLAGRVVRAQVGRAYRRADTVIALAESMKRAIVATMGVKSDDVVVIPNPVSASAILAASEHSVDHPWFASDVPLVVGAGRLHARKDFATLIRAVAVLNRTKAVRLMILGEGPERASLSAWQANSTSHLVLLCRALPRMSIHGCAARTW